MASWVAPDVAGFVLVAGVDAALAFVAIGASLDAVGVTAAVFPSFFDGGASAVLGALAAEFNLADVSGFVGAALFAEAVVLSASTFPASALDGGLLDAVDVADAAVSGVLAGLDADWLASAAISGVAV